MFSNDKKPSPLDITSRPYKPGKPGAKPSPFCDMPSKGEDFRSEHSSVLGGGGLGCGEKKMYK